MYDPPTVEATPMPPTIPIAALKTLTNLPEEKLPPEENTRIEIPIEQFTAFQHEKRKIRIEIPPDLMDVKTTERFPEGNLREQVKPIPVRERVRPNKLSIEPRQKKKRCALFVSLVINEYIFYVFFSISF